MRMLPRGEDGEYVFGKAAVGSVEGRGLARDSWATGCDSVREGWQCKRD